MSQITRREFVEGSIKTLMAVPLLTGSAWAGSPLGSGSVDVYDDLVILPRETWGLERPPRGPMPNEDVRFLLVHHTVTRNDYSESDVPDLIRGFFDFHTSERKGWNDIAYNFLIDRFGRIWEARAGSIAGPTAGDATGGNQGFTQLCAIIGDFTDSMPSQESLDALIRLLSWLADRYGIDTTAEAHVTFSSRGSNRWPAGTEVTTATIGGHRDMSPTACPGDTFYPYVREQLQAAVEHVRKMQQTAAVSTSTSTTLLASATSSTFQFESTTTSDSARSSSTTFSRSTSLPLASPPGPSSSDLLLPAGLVGIGSAVLLAVLFKVARTSSRPPPK